LSLFCINTVNKSVKTKFFVSYLNKIIMQVIRILNQVYLPGKYWSNRNKTSRKFKLLVLKIRNFLNLLSGNDLVSMIKDVLLDEEKETIS
jgi:hypothetical protein